MGILPATDIPKGAYDNWSKYHYYFVRAGRGDSVFRIRAGEDDRIGISGPRRDGFQSPLIHSGRSMSAEVSIKALSMRRRISTLSRGSVMPVMER